MRLGKQVNCLSNGTSHQHKASSHHLKHCYAACAKPKFYVCCSLPLELLSLSSSVLDPSPPQVSVQMSSPHRGPPLPKTGTPYFLQSTWHNLWLASYLQSQLLLSCMGACPLSVLFTRESRDSSSELHITGNGLAPF